MEQAARKPEVVLEISGVSFTYGNRPVLEAVDLTVHEGDFLGVIGPNGSGKTTLLRLILGLLSPAQGEIRVLGQSPRQARANIGYVPQMLSFDPDFPITALEVVLMGRLSRTPRLGPYRNADRIAAREAMEMVSVWNLRSERLGDLSGGQRQRVMIARALVNRPRLLLLDEPTANVDAAIEEDIYELLHRLNRETTLILVTHDLGFVSSRMNRVACLNRRLICHPTEKITGAMINTLYGGRVNMVEHAHRLPTTD